ncbi:MAG: VTT domain-containing protein [Sediminibacterium sp.]|nr:VTT domain-containing protein [Sediminibacterium sp.]
MFLELIQTSEFHWAQLLQPQFYIDFGGIWIILIVIFAETGLFVGFFLPGDSLLFVTGIFAQDIINNMLLNFNINITVNEYLALLIIILLISLMGILGNIVGYAFGRKVGIKMYQWPDRFLFKQKYLQQAKVFYEKYGRRAIVVGRFLPFVRTFAPIVAGIINMDKMKFSFYNIIGCICWVASMILGGFFLQKWMIHNFQFDLTKRLELIVIVIVLITTLPVIYKIVTNKNK